ncbi:MAG: hypothetical protein ACKPKE_27685 [Microcystis panniformis]
MATNSVKKPKSIIRAPRTNFVIKLARYAYANAPYELACRVRVCGFAATNSDEKPKLTICAPRTNFVIKLVRYAYANAPYELACRVRVCGY